jgi:MoaA/NifB/PqqE/SkfB family radical SAM enzyme
MEFSGIKEYRYQKEHLNQVKHITINPNGPGVVRIHMIPPKLSRNKEVPFVLIINGKDILPLNLSWAILLSAFMDEMYKYENREVSDDEWLDIVNKTVSEVQKVYKNVPADTLSGDLMKIIDTLTEIARGREPLENIGVISISEYAKYMTAPHRIDLMISSMCKDGKWNCNQQCIHCYAAGEELANSRELTTDEWKKVIDKCREANIPQLTFTGGEPTLRSDLVELVEYSKWFVTRLNTNGVLLTKELCEQLFNASLDSIQITLYSSEDRLHNYLVGENNWDKTVEGIKNAIESGLNVSINTPLCTVNSNYLETLKFVHSLGVKFVSCSGLIITGNARTIRSSVTQLYERELSLKLKSAFDFCKSKEMEISFTSPGWISEDTLKEIGFTSIPSCGACLSNMAVSPDGSVLPCQSWLTDTSLGNMLTDDWKSIWNNKKCMEIRNTSAKMEQKCQLRGDGR